MGMRIPFWKMHGASNDFVLVDDREQRFPTDDRAWMEAVGRRHTGVGCEGFILIRPAAAADFAMRFFNPDGREAEMCGNGARCVARLAHRLGLAGPRMRFTTAAGEVRAELVGDAVRLFLGDPADWRLDRRLPLADGAEVTCHFVNSGVPHAVVPLADAEALRAYPVVPVGRQLRRHAAFAPAGTNADFIAVAGPDHLLVRTYERGVEDETLACGTGMVACALIAARLGLVRAPVRLTCAAGDTLEVGLRLTPAGATEVTLLGPAQFVFEGVLDYP